MKAWAIIAAAGIGKRMGSDRPKQYLKLGGRPMVCHTLERFREASSIESVVVVVEPGREGAFRKDIIEAHGFPGEWKVVGGGTVRQESVANGLAAVPPDCDVIVVHDGVRPFILPSVIDESVKLAAKDGACIVATPINETIKSVDEHGVIDFTVDRSVMWGAKTPQSFKLSVLREAMDKAREDNFFGTDESSLVERLGINVRVLEGDDRNIKITTPSDLKVAEAILGGWMR
jgi:2-C-methyl-D-erythritol 4-phosphate cytidylyltransferase